MRRLWDLTHKPGNVNNSNVSQWPKYSFRGFFIVTKGKFCKRNTVSMCQSLCWGKIQLHIESWQHWASWNKFLLLKYDFSMKLKHIIGYGFQILVDFFFGTKLTAADELNSTSKIDRTSQDELLVIFISKSGSRCTLLSCKFGYFYRYRSQTEFIKNLKSQHFESFQLFHTVQGQKLTVVPTDCVLLWFCYLLLN